MEHQKGWDAEEIGARVRSVVADMMESLESGQLNRTVKDTLGIALDDARRQMEQYREKMEDARWRRHTGPDRMQEARRPLEIRVNQKGKAAGILFTVFGAMGTGIFGLLAVMILIAMVASVQNPVGWWVFGMCGIIAAGFGFMLYGGISRTGRLARLRQYVKELKLRQKPYCEIADLGRSCGRRPGFVKRDLKKMIGLGMLPDAAMDEEGKWLLLDQETYRQYRLSKEAEIRNQREERDRKKEGKRDAHKENKDAAQQEAARASADGPEEESGTQTVIRQGEQYRDTLRRLGADMAGQPVEGSLKRLDRILGLLFDILKKHPEQSGELENLMEYYLPTTVKLVTTYHELALVEFPGENIKEARAEIEETLDTINRAFENLVDDMYRDTAFDAVTDAAALQAMLARQGMTEKDFQ